MFVVAAAFEVDPLDERASCYLLAKTLQSGGFEEPDGAGLKLWFPVWEWAVKRHPGLRDKATATFVRGGGEAGPGADSYGPRPHRPTHEAGIRRGIA
jgi:hypothetical protein